MFAREEKYGAHNYHPLPVALCHGKGMLRILILKWVKKPYISLLKYLNTVIWGAACFWMPAKIPELPASLILNAFLIGLYFSIIQGAWKELRSGESSGMPQILPGVLQYFFHQCMYENTAPFPGISFFSPAWYSILNWCDVYNSFSGLCTYLSLAHAFGERGKLCKRESV